MFLELSQFYTMLWIVKKWAFINVGETTTVNSACNDILYDILYDYSLDGLNVLTYISHSTDTIYNMMKKECCGFRIVDITRLEEMFDNQKYFCCNNEWYRKTEIYNSKLLIICTFWTIFISTLMTWVDQYSKAKIKK